MGVEIAGLICGCGSALAAVLVAGLLLRLAVSLTNRIVGTAKVKAQSRSSGGIPEWDWDDWDDEYAAPGRPQRRKDVIPEPGIIKCVAILFATALVFVVGCVMVAVFAEAMVGLRLWRDESKLVVAILNLPVADLALTVLLITLLPTTFWRAAMVTFVYNLLLLALALGIGGVVLVFAVVLG